MMNNFIKIASGSEVLASVKKKNKIKLFCVLEFKLGPVKF